MDHHYRANMFATCGHDVHIWDEIKSSPIRTFSWGVDSVQSIKFNPVDVSKKSLLITIELFYSVYFLTAGFLIVLVFHWLGKKHFALDLVG